MSVLPSYVMVHCVYVWYLQRPEKDIGSLKSELQTVVSCHVCVGINPGSPSRTASVSPSPSPAFLRHGRGEEEGSAEREALATNPELPPAMASWDALGR